jgi:hypothetical protein
MDMTIYSVSINLLFLVGITKNFLNTKRNQFFLSIYKNGRQRRLEQIARHVTLISYLQNIIIKRSSVEFNATSTELIETISVGVEVNHYL